MKPWIALFLVLMSPACGPAPEALSATAEKSHAPCAAKVEGPYVVAHVSDGDTIMIRTAGRKTLTVRLLGVDAPEVDGPYRRAERGGTEAKAFVHSLLAGQSVYVEVDPGEGRRDKHGRELAYLYRAADCLFVNGEIIKRGYGRTYRRFPLRHREMFDRFEREARRSRVGLWK